jgi:hypothetical protein
MGRSIAMVGTFESHRARLGTCPRICPELGNSDPL